MVCAAGVVCGVLLLCAAGVVCGVLLLCAAGVVCGVMLVVRQVCDVCVSVWCGVSQVQSVRMEACTACVGSTWFTVWGPPGSLRGRFFCFVIILVQPLPNLKGKTPKPDNEPSQEQSNIK